MGASSSISDYSTSSLTADEVSEMVGSIGRAYEDYKSIIIDNCIDGQFLCSLNSTTEVDELIKEFKVCNIVHRKKLSEALYVIVNKNNRASTPSDGRSPQFAESIPHSLSASRIAGLVPSNYKVREEVQESPRSIMSRLFLIQGIECDVQQVELSALKIIEAVGKGFGDGVSKYDCFLSYRVSSESDLAEKLYYALRGHGVHAFLDKCV